MTTYKVHKTKDFTVMSNYHLRDRNLSLKAKGLLSVMLSLPDDWDYSINGLVAICKENNTAVESALKELRENSYLIVTKKMPNETESGRIEYEYDIYEKPQILDNQHIVKQELEKQGVENLGVEFQGVENNPQLNTNQLRTKELNTNNKSKSYKVKFDEIINSYSQDEIINDLLHEWLEVRKAKKAAMTEKAIQLNINKLDKLAKESNMSVVDYLQEVICRGWAAFYAIKQWNNAPAKTYGATGQAIKKPTEDDLEGIL